jgi:hypothetical protein
VGATNELDDICHRKLNVENVQYEQAAQYGDLHMFAKNNDAFVVGGDVVLYRMLKDETKRQCESSERILVLRMSSRFRMDRRLYVTVRFCARWLV